MCVESTNKVSDRIRERRTDERNELRIGKPRYLENNHRVDLRSAQLGKSLKVIRSGRWTGLVVYPGFNESQSEPNHPN
jgi:hypothetical protein